MFLSIQRSTSAIMIRVKMVESALVCQVTSNVFVHRDGKEKTVDLVSICWDDLISVLHVAHKGSSSLHQRRTEQFPVILDLCLRKFLVGNIMNITTSSFSKCVMSKLKRKAGISNSFGLKSVLVKLCFHYGSK